jgi:hypothetical protein
MSEIQKLLYSCEEAGASIALSPRTLYNNVSLARKGKAEYLIKPRYKGKRLMFHIDDLRAFADSLPSEPQVKRKPRLKAEAGK